jgi:hypothetical protein
VGKRGRPVLDGMSLPQTCEASVCECLCMRVVLDASEGLMRWPVAAFSHWGVGFSSNFLSVLSA